MFRGRKSLLDLATGYESSGEPDEDVRGARIGAYARENALDAVYRAKQSC